MKPIGPKSPKPPKIESRIRKGCTFIPRFIRRGVNTLSESPTKTTPHVAKPIKLKSEPVAKRYKIAGAITIDEPTNGISDAKAETAPKGLDWERKKSRNPTPLKILLSKLSQANPERLNLWIIRLFSLFARRKNQRAERAKQADERCAPRLSKSKTKKQS